ncbi:MAG: TetR/AcrR family transcriptional regulator [Peptococcaceae bacterium]|jgi:AcrR family transcriptional regulator|nr:TetR/AcrR family transcriptional regulator [Peptococcaceae bacterium]
MRPRLEQEREYRREMIINATERLLKEKDFESITMEDIAGVSDFCKASIYQYFKNKEELILAVFARIMDAEYALIEEKCSSQTDPVQAIRNYICLEFEFFYQRPWSAKIILNFPFRDFHPENSSLPLKYAQKKKLIAAIIQRGQREGKFITADTQALTNMILTISKGFATYLSAVFTADIKSPEIEMFISMIIKGITKEAQ